MLTLLKTAHHRSTPCWLLSLGNEHFALVKIGWNFAEVNVVDGNFCEPDQDELKCLEKEEQIGNRLLWSATTIRQYERWDKVNYSKFQAKKHTLSGKMIQLFISKLPSSPHSSTLKMIKHKPHVIPLIHRPIDYLPRAFPHAVSAPSFRSCVVQCRVLVE